MMMRLLGAACIVALLAACSLSPTRKGQDARIVDESQYCGTSSQNSEVHYFADRDTFDDWLKYRSIKTFDPALARNGGVIIVDMGQRPTGGYNLKLNRDKSTIKNGTLTLNMTWNAPRLDAAVSQALIAQCVAIKPPTGEYNRVEVVDQLGNPRGQASLDRSGG